MPFSLRDKRLPSIISRRSLGISLCCDILYVFTTLVVVQRLCGATLAVASAVGPDSHSFVHKCLSESRSVYGTFQVPWSSESRRREEFLRMHTLTEITRAFDSHKYGGYGGPWIENLWFKTMCCNRNMSDFGVWIPLFVPWTDWFLAMNSDERKWQRMIRPILRAMLKQFVYVTVIQLESGMEAGETPYSEIPPNLLIMSPGGKGHIPLILSIKGQNFIGRTGRYAGVVFAGSARAKRKMVLDHWKGLLGDKLTIAKTKAWMDLYRDHDFVLSPRGNGRGCFRTGEALEMGLIVIMAFRTRLWVPYLNSTLPWDKTGFYSVMSDAKSVIDKILAMSESDILAMRGTCRRYKHSHFTMNASVAQIGYFMKYGFKRSDLRCNQYYVDV